jgi:hypothetical protein
MQLVVVVMSVLLLELRDRGVALCCVVVTVKVCQI